MRNTHIRRKKAFQQRQINLGLIHFNLDSACIAAKKHDNSTSKGDAQNPAASNEKFSGYCFKCWLYGHKQEDCRAKNVQPHPDYDHLKGFIAKQKERSMKESKPTELPTTMELGDIAKPLAENRRYTSATKGLAKTHEHPSLKVFSVDALDRQIQIFSKTKYALRKNAVTETVRAPRSRRNPVAYSNDPLSAKGGGRSTVAQMPLGVRITNKETWQTVTIRKAVRSSIDKNSPNKIDLKNSFGILEKLKTPKKRKNQNKGVLKGEGTQREKPNPVCKQLHTDVGLFPPLLNKTLGSKTGRKIMVNKNVIDSSALHSGYDSIHKAHQGYSPPHKRTNKEFLKGHNPISGKPNRNSKVPMPKTTKDIYSPPHRRGNNIVSNTICGFLGQNYHKINLDSKCILQKQNVCAETGVICKWLGTGASITDIADGLISQLPAKTITERRSLSYLLLHTPL